MVAGFGMLPSPPCLLIKKLNPKVNINSIILKDMNAEMSKLPESLKDFDFSDCIQNWAIFPVSDDLYPK